VALLNAGAGDLRPAAPPVNFGDGVEQVHAGAVDDGRRPSMSSNGSSPLTRELSGAS